MSADKARPSMFATRRAVLASVAGGLTAAAAALVGRPSRARATDGQPVLIGQTNSGTATTTVQNSDPSEIGFHAESLAVTGGGLALAGSSYSPQGTGVRGLASDTGSGPNYGVRGQADGQDGVGVLGQASGGTGARGVQGEADSGHGVHGIATTGYAGYFEGKVYTSKYHEMKEVSAPPAPAADKARIFLRDNGSGKTQLCIRYSSGAIQVINTQP